MHQGQVLNLVYWKHVKGGNLRHVSWVTFECEKDKGNHSNLSEGLNENNDRFVVKLGMPTTFTLEFNRL